MLKVFSAHMNFRKLASITLLLLSGCSGDSWFGSDKKLELPGERLPIFSKENPITNKGSSRPLHIAPTSKLADNQSGGYLSDFTHISNVEASSSAVELDISFDSDNEFGLVSLPLIINNKIITNGADSRVTAFDRHSGNFLWQSVKTDDLSAFNFWNSSKFIGGGLGYGKGTIIATNGLSEVYAFREQDGTTLWEAKLSGPSRANPMVVDNIVIVQTIDNKTYALNLEDGSLVWNHQGFGDKLSTLASSTALSYKNMAIVQYPSGDIFALDIKTGEELWTISIDEGVEVLSTKFHLENFIPHPVIKGNHLFAYGADGMLAKFDLTTQERLWQIKHGANKPIWISGDMIFATTGRTLKAIDSHSGALAWEVNLSVINPSENHLTYTSPTIINGKLVIASSNGLLLEFAPLTGDLLSKSDILSDATLQVVALSDGTYVLSSSGRLMRYQLD